MSKIKPETINTRNQLLMSFVAGATGLATSVIFAKLTSDIGVGNLVENSSKNIR